MIEVEITTEIWRTEDMTLVVMYPFPNVAYIKGLRGKYTKSLRKEMTKLMKSKGVDIVHYERRKNQEVTTFSIEIKLEI